MKVMRKWLSREKRSKKNHEITGGIADFIDDRYTRKAGQGVKDDTVPQGVWYDVIFARRHSKV
jgi:hypothetical protein